MLFSGYLQNNTLEKVFPFVFSCPTHSLPGSSLVWELRLNPGKMWCLSIRNWFIKAVLCGSCSQPGALLRLSFAGRSSALQELQTG